MKQLQKTTAKGRAPRKKPREPLEEGIIVPRDAQGRRAWRKMSDAEVIYCAKQFILKNNISSRGEFQKKDNGFYLALGRRNLVDAAFEGIKPIYCSYPACRIYLMIPQVDCVFF